MKIKSTKLLAILLAVCMMFSFSSVVFAANLPAGLPAGGLDEILGIYNQLDVSQKVGLLDEVHTALKEENLLEDDTFKAFKDFHTEVKNASESGNVTELDRLFAEEAIKDVAKDTKEKVDSSDVDMNVVTGVVAEVVVNTEHIDDDTKAEIVDKVVENLGDANVGVQIPAKIMKVYTYLSDNGFIDAAQKMALMKLAVDVINGKEVNYEKAASTLYDILASNKNISLAQIVGLVEFVFETYEDEIAGVYAKAFKKADELGLIDKAVKALELADSKLAEAAEIVKTDLTGMALADELLEEIELADATFDEIIALLKNGSEFNKVLGLKDNLVAHLDVIKTLSYEHTKAGLAELIDDVHALYFAALEATYLTYEICGGDIEYLALGGTMTMQSKYYVDFAKKLDAELAKIILNGDVNVTEKVKINVTAQNIVDFVNTNAAQIKAADVITFNMDAYDTFMTLGTDVVKGADNVVDWSKYVDAETEALAVKALAKVNKLLAEKYDAAAIAKIEDVAEVFAYSLVSYAAETYKALELIAEINPTAKVIVIGMVNPFVGVSVKYEDEIFPLDAIFDLVIEATDIYNGIYAMFAEEVTFVSVADAESANAVAKEITFVDVRDFAGKVQEILVDNASDLTDDGKDFVVAALLEAIDLKKVDHTFGNDNVCDICGYTKPEPFVPTPAGPSAPSHFDCDGGENCYCNKYTDLDNTMWYHQGVCYMIKHGYMIGIGDGKWAPEQIITRAEIATILWRIAGSEVVDYALDFSDVEADMWYTEAIEWAVSEEIFLGYGDGKFGPNDQITREQMVTVMYRYELDNGKKLTADFDMTTVSDADEISDWALEAMTWALDCGLIIGTDVDVLTASPLKTATRAEVAMIFYRKLDNLLK